MEKIAFDTETTGLNLEKDRVIQLSILIFDEKWELLLEKCRLINPTIPIPKEASAIHGINDEDVRDAPTFKKIAKAIAALFIGREIVGYNVLGFDLPILAAEFERAGVDCPFSDKIIDVYRIEANLFPRDLSSIYKKYTGYQLQDAHDALADIKATCAVLQHQLPLIGDRNVFELSESTNIIDYTGKLARNSDGNIVFAFGKHIGKLLKDEKEYCEWMLKADFSRQVKDIIKKEIYG